MRFLDEQEAVSRGDERLSLILSLILLELSLGRPHDSTGARAGRALAAKAQEFLTVKALEPKTSTASIAKRLRCNPDYLGRVYRQEFGHSVTDGLHQLRVKQAKRLLLENRLTIGEAAAECGFGDLAFFRKVFKRVVGTTPVAFRRLHSRIHVNTE